MKNEQNRVCDASTIIKEPQQSLKRQQYRVFLFEVHKACGPVGVLLCASELGQHTATGMRKGDRASLVKLFQAEKETDVFTCNVLHKLAQDHGIPEEIDCKASAALFNCVMVSLTTESRVNRFRKR